MGPKRPAVYYTKEEHIIYAKLNTIYLVFDDNGRKCISLVNKGSGIDGRGKTLIRLGIGGDFL